MFTICYLFQFSPSYQTTLAPQKAIQHTFVESSKPSLGKNPLGKQTTVSTRYRGTIVVSTLLNTEAKV